MLWSVRNLLIFQTLPRRPAPEKLVRGKWPLWMKSRRGKKSEPFFQSLEIIGLLAMPPYTSLPNRSGHTFYQWIIDEF
jgi:hypothetical protein